MKRTGTRRRPLHRDDPFRRIAAPDVEPGVVNSQHLGPLDASSVQFDRTIEGFLQSQSDEFSCGAGGASPATWGAPPNAQRLQVHIGPTAVPIHVWARASFGWVNNNVNDIHARFCFLLIDQALGSQTFKQRNANIPSTFVPGNSHIYQVTGDSKIVVPVRDGADWYLTLSYAGDRSVVTPNQRINRQSILGFVTAPVPGADATYVDDAQL